MKISPADFVSGNAINSMGISAPPPVEHTPVPVSQPSPRVYQERVHVSVNTLPEFNSVSTHSLYTVSPRWCQTLHFQLSRLYSHRKIKARCLSLLRVYIRGHNDKERTCNS